MRLAGWHKIFFSRKEIFALIKDQFFLRSHALFNSRALS
jgi:hypothetical protein